MGVPHSFVRKQGLSDPSLMQQWMEIAGTSRSSSCTRSESISSTDVEVSVCAVTSPAQKGAEGPSAAAAAVGAYAQ